MKAQLKSGLNLGLFAAALVLAAGGVQAKPAPTATSAAAVLKAEAVGSESSGAAQIVNVSVTGMVCGLCAQGIEKRLMALEGVKAVEVDLDALAIKISLNAQTKKEATEPLPTDEQITQAIVSAGYPVIDIKRMK